jgi:hypothetical protein
MKLRSTILISLSIALTFIGCKRESIYTCGNSPSSNITSIPSKILSLQTIGFADTTLAVIYGKTFGKDSIDSRVIVDTLFNTRIEFIDLEKRDTIIVSSDVQGKYQKYLRPSTYDIIISYVGFNVLRIENVSFKLSEIKELDVLLGQGPYNIDVLDLN